jgi:glycerophosphoryl diester phosphodiesterase
VTVPVFHSPGTLVGHRGLGKGSVDGVPENTVESFLAAVELGLDWLEIDVQSSSDNQLLVVHDATLPDGTVLADVTAAEAARRGALVLTDLLDALPTRVGVVFDVKSSLHDAHRSASATTATALARTCARRLQDRPALALSFDPAALHQMRSELPTLALGLLTWHRFPVAHAVAAAAHLDVQVLALHAGSLWRNASSGRHAPLSVHRVVSHVHDAKRQLLVWCPSERRARVLANAGADALVVDDVLRHVRSATRLHSRR